jgi:hypothetical protein
LNERSRAFLLEVVFLDLLGARVRIGGLGLQKAHDGFRTSRARQHGIHGDTRSLRHLGQTPGNDHLPGLCHAVVNHVWMNFCGGLTGDEDDATRVALEHGGEVVPSQANPSQEIDLEIVQPILVGDIRKIFGFIDTDILILCVSYGKSRVA